MTLDELVRKRGWLLVAGSEVGIQKACEFAYRAGGGSVYLLGGTYKYPDIPETVSLEGVGFDVQVSRGQLKWSIAHCMICGADMWGDSRDCIHSRMFIHNITGRPLVEASAYGPKCLCCGLRNMVRTNTLEYKCLKTGQIFSLKELLFERGK